MEFSTILLSFVDIKISSQVVFVVIANQNEVTTDFKIFCRSEPIYVFENSQSINLYELF